MSNAWIDDAIQRQPWLRSVGQTGALLYLFATNLVHHECRARAVLTRQELRDEYPWPLTDRDFDVALERLAARDRIALDGDVIELPLYDAEQESNAVRRDRAARNRKIAAEAVSKRQRDASGKLVPSSATLESMLARPASGPIRSGPVLSGPVLPERYQDPPVSPHSPDADPMSPDGAAPAAPPRRKGQVALVEQDPDPGAGEGPRETPLETIARYASTPCRNDGGQDRSWRFYAALFYADTDSLPTFPERGKKRWGRLLREHGVDEFCRRVRVYFESPPKTKFLDQGARDFDRLIEHFDLMARGSGLSARRESTDRYLGVKNAIRERLAALGDAAPATPPEYLAWLSNGSVPTGGTDAVVR